MPIQPKNAQNDWHVAHLGDTMCHANINMMYC